MSGFNLELSETHELIRQTARDFAKNEVAPTTIERRKRGLSAQGLRALTSDQ